MEKDTHAITKQKEARVAILILDGVDFRAQKITQDKHIIIKE